MFRIASFVLLLLTVACGQDVLTCRSDSDCPPIDVCNASTCVTLERTPTRDAGRVDAGHHDAGMDAGVDAGIDAGIIVVPPACTPRRCADVGAACGSAPDGCGGQLSCGSCPAPQSCGAIQANRCGCQPKTCASLGATCGTHLPDGCGGIIASCGAVPDCGGGQWSCDSASHACRCAPKTCASLGATCGENLPDGCGGTIPFCGAGLNCGGGQMYCDSSVNRCACRASTCTTLNATCGTNLPDGCGGTIASCGVGTACGPFQVCGVQRQCVCASTVDSPDDLFEDTNCDGLDGDANEAVFLSMGGNDGNAGGKATPVSSLSRALALASANGKRQIFVAAGDYAAPAGWASGVSLIGGYDAAWRRSANPAARAVIHAPSTGLLIDHLTSATSFERVIIQGASGAAAQGMRVVNSGAYLTLRFVQIIAGSAAHGVDGPAGKAGAHGASGFPGETATRGLPNTTASGGVGGLSAGDGSGWAGGNGGAGSNPDGQPGSGPFPGAGGSSGCYAAGNGLNGGSGTTPSPGADGVSARGFGSLSAAGVWVAPLAASDGAPGRAGTGGSSGGGGGKLACLAFHEAGGGGGGGGASGTGGNGGGAGTSGGASIALVLIASNPALTGVSLQTGTAGMAGLGGRGGAGGPGGAGGAGGSGVAWIDAFGTFIHSGLGGWGGAGGAGSAGGKGGDGAAGPSIGVWCSGVSGFAGGNGTTWSGARLNLFGC